MELGAYAYLEKPLNSLKVLENIVNSALKDRNGKGGEDA
jgi:DNA-binding NtrC family response regulator